MSRKSLRHFSIVIVCISGIFLSNNDAQCQSVFSIEDGITEINGTELFYKKMGKGEPIIIVHGGPVLDHGYLVPHFKSLAEEYELLFYDQRLSGRSSANVDSTDITLDHFVEDIEGLRKEFKYKKVHLMAHSWGGLLAMKYAIKYPGNLTSLILLNSMPASAELWQRENNKIAERVTEEDNRNRQEIMNSDLMKTDPSQAIEKLLILSFRNQFQNRDLADSLDFYIPGDYMIRSQRFGYLMPELSNYDLQEGLTSLSVPTFLVYGENEPAAEISGKDLNHTLPNSSLSIIPNSGHFPFIEQRDVFMKELQTFLNSLD